MPNSPYQRSTWTILLFLGLLMPFVLVLVVTLGHSVKLGRNRGETAATQDGAATQTGTTTVAGTQPALTQSTTHTAATRNASTPTAATQRARQAETRLLVASDGRTLWIANPTVSDFGGLKRASFTLYLTENGTQTWSALPDHWDQPRGIAVMSFPPKSKDPASICVFQQNGGAVRVYGAKGGDQALDPLPVDHDLLAAAGSAEGVFAITYGVPHSSTKAVGDVLNVSASDADPSKPRFPLATSTAPATTTSKPATTLEEKVTTARPAVNVYRFKGKWRMLPSLGETADAGAPMPRVTSKVSLLQRGERIIAMWVDPEKPAELVVRSLEYNRKDAKWSKAVVSELWEPVPENSRLMTLALDETVYAFWAAPRVEKSAGDSPEAKADGSGLELHGGWILTNGSDADLTLPAQNRVPPLKLDGVAATAAELDIGAAENSIAVIVKGEKELTSRVFDVQGKLLRGPVAVKADDPMRDAQYAQNVALLLLALLMTLSLWQWKQRPASLKLPRGMVIGSAMSRALAFLIDAGAAFALLATFLIMTNSSEGYARLISGWSRSIMNFDLLLKAPELIAFWGLYLLHVAVGELIFHRSLGKALTGLRVVMLDGSPPTVAAIIVRNIIRLPELLLPISVIYVIISRYRQRLGDVVARTLVVGSSPDDATDHDRE